MYSSRSYKLTKKEYNYLLPVLKNKLLYQIDSYYFVGAFEDLEDMLLRLKGLYGYFNNYNKIVNYKCFKEYSLKEFRNIVKK